MLRSFRMLVGAAALLLLAPAAVQANEMLVTSCHDPLGQPNAAVGWGPFATPAGTTANLCGQANGGLQARLTTDKPPGDASASWRFDAPPGTRIVRVRITRSTTGFSAGPTFQANDVSYVMEASDGQTLEECALKASGSSCSADLSGAVDKQGLNAAWVQIRVLCTNGGLPCSRPLALQATHLWVTLADAQAPTVSTPQVLDNGDSSGTLRVRYDAADVGVGLYQTIAKVDGKIAGAKPLAPAPCSDVNPSDADPFQFTVPVPCPGTITGAEGSVDVRTLPAGPHIVELAVLDAAGNERTAFGPIEFPRANAAITGASTPEEIKNLRSARLKMWFVKASHRGRRYTSRYGTRVVTRGILRGLNGRGIHGARVDVYHIRNGKRRLVKTGLKSRAGGKLTLILPLNVDTRTIEYSYRALRPGPITSRQRLSLKVMRNGRVFHRR
jgi:hypothetical protein